MKTADIAVTYKGHYGSDLDVVNAARVSFDKESEWVYESEGHEASGEAGHLSTADTRLINYLAKHKHFSPFNHTFLSFRIKAPIYAARQLVKHEYLPWNEVSRRYVDSEPEFYMPELRGRAADKKQGSLDSVVDVAPFKMENGSAKLSVTPEGATGFMLAYYQHLLSEGVAPEVARGFLPHTLMTEWIWSGTLGAVAKMLKLRLDPHAQAESRIVAELIKAEVEKLFPVSIKALLENNG